MGSQIMHRPKRARIELRPRDEIVFPLHRSVVVVGDIVPQLIIPERVGCPKSACYRLPVHCSLQGKLQSR